MIQQILFQRYTYIRKRLLLLGESTTERSLANSARNTGTLKQITHNIQKTNMDTSWKEVSGKKRTETAPKCLVNN
jgi:hypothetical protein